MLKRLAAAIAMTATLDAAAVAAPARIVSINLCADQLLLTLADPGQIVALSAFAHDRELSLMAEEAAPYPAIAGEAEAVIDRTPDLVLSGTFSNALTNAFVIEKGIPILVLEPVRSFADITAQVRLVAGAVGRPERGEAFIAALDAAVARAEAGRPATPLSAIALSRRGWVSGVDSLDSRVMEAVGLFNAAGQFGIGGEGGLVTLEALVAADIDVVLLDRESVLADDQGAALLSHPALEEAFPPDRRLVVSGPLTLCGGPGVITALDRLAGQVAALRR